MKKLELRKKYLDLRKIFSNEEVAMKSKQLFNNFENKFPVLENQNIHIFLSIKNLKEIDTQLFIDYFWRKKANVFVPKIFKNKLISVQYTPETLLIESSWGILEPETNVNEGNSFDLIVTPLVYCDHSGNRIGYGKGFYDQFFAGVNQNAEKIGTGLFPPNEEIEDISESDIPLDYLVLPTEVLSFGGFASKSTK